MIKLGNYQFKTAFNEITPSFMDILKAAQQVSMGANLMAEGRHYEEAPAQYTHPSNEMADQEEDTSAVNATEVISRIRDILYSVKKTFREIFDSFKEPNGTISQEGFIQMINKQIE